MKENTLEALDVLKEGGCITMILDNPPSKEKYSFFLSNEEHTVVASVDTTTFLELQAGAYLERDPYSNFGRTFRLQRVQS